MREDEIMECWHALMRRAAAAAGRVGRSPAVVRIVAVSKGQPAAAMLRLQEGLRRGGQTALFGESYVQEFRAKRTALGAGAHCHLIGALQRNKAKAAVELFDVIETIDSPRLADAVSQAALGCGKRQAVFMQVNVSADEAKHGCRAEEASDLARHITERCGGLQLCGLMTITRFYDDAEQARPDFRRAAALARVIAGELRGEAPFEISMGMSGDFETAIEEGATLVRIGTALFGGRTETAAAPVN